MKDETVFYFDDGQGFKQIGIRKNYILNQIILAAVALDYLYMPQRRQEEKHPSLILSTQAVRIRKEENMSSLWYKEPAKVWEEALPLGERQNRCNDFRWCGTGTNTGK